jgi:uncharacterized protein (TIGR02300 family)
MQDFPSTGPKARHPLKSTAKRLNLRCRYDSHLALTGAKSLVKGTDNLETRLHVAKSELGTKRIDPETGRKFYDLNKDPIVSPYTGKTYPRSYFDAGNEKVVDDEDENEEVEALDDAPEVVSLEDADDEAAGGDDLPDLGDDDVDLGDDGDDDTFLEEEEEDNDDVSDMIGMGDDDDDA